MVGNPQLAAPWFEIAHQRCARVLSVTMIVPAADKMRAVRAARMSCPVWQWLRAQYVVSLAQSNGPFEISSSPSTAI